MPDLYAKLRPLLFRLDPETAHNLTLKVLKTGLLPRIASPDDPALRVTLWDRTFPNPVGLAAGFDKNAQVIRPMLRLGFGFVETGTVTPKPQHGNARPRIFRDPDHETVINRMGFPNLGLNKFKASLEKFLDSKPRPPGLVGINIGMNKSRKDPAKDYCLLIRQLGPLADYLVINISSPNTPGLRDLQKREALLDLLAKTREALEKTCGEYAPPMLLKLAPDLSDKQLGEITATIIDSKIDGLILTNTTTSRPDSLPASFAREKGGLSGTKLRKRSTEIIREFYRLTKGNIPIIGLGGISSGDHAYEKIKAGATLVQLYTALVFQGPNVVNEINASLARLLKADGFGHISEAVGIESGVRKESRKSTHAT